MYLLRTKTVLVLSLALLVSIALYIFSSSVVFAQTPTPRRSEDSAAQAPANREAPNAPINLTLSPTFINLATDPGKAVSSQLRLTNNNAFTEYLRMEVAKYTVGADGERLNIVPLESGDEFGEWVEFDDSEFSLAANQTRTVRFTIAPPKDAALGYYYAFIIRRVTEQEGDANTRLTGAPAFTTVLEVRSPNAKRELQLVSFATDKGFYEYLPATFNVTFKNTGNLHIVPHGDIFIDQGGRRDIAILKINEGQGNILPGATRTYTATWNDALIARVPKTDESGKELRDRKNNPIYEVKFDSDKPVSKFRIGSFKANLLAVYDNGNRDIPLESSLSFVVFPWKLVTGAIVVIVGPVALYHLLNRRRKRK